MTIAYMGLKRCNN